MFLNHSSQCSRPSWKALWLLSLSPVLWLTNMQSTTSETFVREIVHRVILDFLKVNGFYGSFIKWIYWVLATNIEDHLCHHPTTIINRDRRCAEHNRAYKSRVNTATFVLLQNKSVIPSYYGEFATSSVGTLAYSLSLFFFLNSFTFMLSCCHSTELSVWV